MTAKKTFRVAILGTPQAEQWLLAHALSATPYELVTERPDMYVVDVDHDHAVARWAALDSKGSVPAAFFSRVHPRAKCGVVVPRPHTSGNVVEALDQIRRRFFSEPSSAPARTARPAPRALEMAHAVA